MLREDLRAASRRLPGSPDDARNELAFVDPPGDLDPFGDIHRLAALIAPAMASLSLRPREAIRLIVLAGHSLEEASRLTEGSSNALRHRSTAALDQLCRSLSHCPADQCPHNGPIPQDCPALRRGASCLKYEILANL
jgi:DNA-directed RNA polymerase specialized sigma24 family protein